jgi:hypothetical protein
MAGISLSTNFDVGAALHLDSREEITKAEMLTINENIYPEDLLVICSDDHKVYLFSKSNESDPETGKFREFKTGTEITVDDEMSLTSENPVQNKVITIALNGKLGIEDTMPTPSADYLGTIGIYGGETTSDYTHGYFYECVSDGENPATYSWEPLKVQETTPAILDRSITTNVDVGGIPAGTTLQQGLSFTDYVEKVHVIEIAPTVSFSSTNSGVREEGTSVTPTMTLTISDAGTGTPVSISFYSGSTLLDTQEYVSGTNTYTYTMETAISTDTTVKGVLSYKKSDDSNATIEKTASYTFVMASYYGAVSTAPTTQAGVIALTKAVKNTKAFTTTYVLTNQKSCYCYPASFGNLTSIKDANNFEYIQSYTKTNVSVDGVSYNVYTLTDPVTIASFKQIFA